MCHMNVLAHGRMPLPEPHPLVTRNRIAQRLLCAPQQYPFDLLRLVAHDNHEQVPPYGLAPFYNSAHVSACMIVCACVRVSVHLPKLCWRTCVCMHKQVQDFAGRSCDCKPVFLVGEIDRSIAVYINQNMCENILDRLCMKISRILVGDLKCAVTGHTSHSHSCMLVVSACLSEPALGRESSQG